ncbi:MAG TPA: flagellar hook-basal body complex protein FliE [Burkholderiaceae bacterium]|jgi:flagellar hook-basal body complex protein FliE|nr:flagellar hook-basal body complex protein FliE [Burkholderiaceae bacterium]
MSIETIQSISQPIGQIGEAAQSNAVEKGGKSVGPGSFAETLGNAMQKVDAMQVDADQQAEKVALGGGNLHEMSMALEKADISMRLAMKVRSKLVDAYQEIMRMSV